MAKLNLDFLINTPEEESIANIDLVFEKVAQEIELYLGLEPIDNDIKVSLIDSELSDLNTQTDIFSIGTHRFYENDTLQIQIFRDYSRFIPIIILREVYKCFVPTIGAHIKPIDIFISQKVSIDLAKFSSIKEWNLIITDKLVNYEFISKEYNRLENFLKQGSTGDSDSPFKFFFKYIRRNIKIIVEQQDDFYDTLFEEYMLISSKSLYDDDIVETIRVLDKIFRRVKYYTAMLDYQHYFTTFKEDGFIQTYLSLNKFTENMQWIKNFSSFSPSYAINWPLLNILSINCCLKFNPIIKRSEIVKFINELPFFVLLKESRSSFGFEIEGFFVCPKQYFKDIVRFLEKLEENGYVLQTKLTTLEKGGKFVNLNYFREYHNEKTIANKMDKFYDKKYELYDSMDYGQREYGEKLSLLDWLIIDRVRYFSQTGFTFEKKAGTLKILKTDLINEVIGQRKLIDDLKSNLFFVHSSTELRDLFLDILKTNESFGFFYIKNMLHKYIIIIDLIKEVLSKKSSINSQRGLLEHIKRQGVSYSIENNLILMDSSIKKAIFNEFVPLFFKSKEKFEKIIKRFTNIYKVISSCYDLKIFNLQSIRRLIENKSLLDTIFKSKEQKLKSCYENYKLSEINYQTIGEKLENFLNHDPPVISPNLNNTIFTPKTQLYILLLNCNSKTLENLHKVSYIAKRMGIGSATIIYATMLIPYLKNEEKSTLISILANIFKEDLISVKRYVWGGFQEAFSRKDFYDLEQKEFFYTKDLFEQYFLNVRSILGEELNPLPESPNRSYTKFWSKEDDLSVLIKSVEDRVKNEPFDLDRGRLGKLVEFNEVLKDKILDLNGFKKCQENLFFQNYIKSINFIPSFQHFGMSQYSLYFYPTDINQIDFKLLLSNSFQSINYPAQIDNSNSFLIRYIFPFRNPGISSYLNWLTKSKKKIREYCLFFVKKMYQVFHFNYNLDPEGWDLDPNKFKIYFQNVLFNPDYKLEVPKLKEFIIGDSNGSNYLGPESVEFKALSEVYGKKSLDIKTYRTKRYFNINKSIAELLQKDLIIPYISVKNLDIIEKVTIILPNIKKEHNESILKIFSFFNIGFIYEMEGEYYIHGFEDVIKFENGIMIKLYFPDCQIDEFEKLFDLLFEYMEIDHYLILNDLIDGENLIKSTFNGLKFLETYNPLTNLIWNDKDKKWRNHKLFNENFEPVYPDLFFGKKNYDLDS